MSHTSTPPSGSATQTITGHEHAQPVLRLRGGPAHSRRVVWDDDVVDNEFLNKKSSKICCIYHKPRKFDESSSESSSSSDSEDDKPPAGSGRNIGPLDPEALRKLMDLRRDGKERDDGESDGDFDNGDSGPATSGIPTHQSAVASSSRIPQDVEPSSTWTERVRTIQQDRNDRIVKGGTDSESEDDSRSEDSDGKPISKKAKTKKTRRVKQHHHQHTAECEEEHHDHGHQHDDIESMDQPDGETPKQSYQSAKGKHPKALKKEKANKYERGLN